MADVLQRALNAGVAPRRVLWGHAHDQLSNFGHDTLAAESRCEACGRMIPYQFVFVGYDQNMKPADLP